MYIQNIVSGHIIHFYIHYICGGLSSVLSSWKQFSLLLAAILYTETILSYCLGKSYKWLAYRSHAECDYHNEINYNAIMYDQGVNISGFILHMHTNQKVLWKSGIFIFLQWYIFQATGAWSHSIQPHYIPMRVHLGIDTIVNWTNTWN